MEVKRIFAVCPGEKEFIFLGKKSQYSGQNRKEYLLNMQNKRSKDAKIERISK